MIHTPDCVFARVIYVFAYCPPNPVPPPSRPRCIESPHLAFDRRRLPLQLRLCSGVSSRLIHHWRVLSVYFVVPFSLVVP